MKLVGAAMLRNEADVVESFVRRNLSLLVGLLVVAHGSSDGTSEILDALVAEGLSLEVDRDEGPATNTGRCARTAGVGPVVAGCDLLGTVLQPTHQPHLNTSAL